MRAQEKDQYQKTGILIHCSIERTILLRVVEGTA